MYDFSVLALEEAIGDDYGWLGYGYDCDLVEYDVVTAGERVERGGMRSARCCGMAFGLGAWMGWDVVWCGLELGDRLVMMLVVCVHGGGGAMGTSSHTNHALTVHRLPRGQAQVAHVWRWRNT